jgi:uncharacterized protein (DUF433 family)
MTSLDRAAEVGLCMDVSCTLPDGHRGAHTDGSAHWTYRSASAGADKPLRPHVHVDPAVRFGQPHIGGVNTEMLAGQFSAGASLEELCEDYGLTRHQVLLALWYEGTHGRKQARRLYGKWAEKAAYPVLSGFDKTRSVDDIPLPEVDRG